MTLFKKTQTDSLNNYFVPTMANDFEFGANQKYSDSSERLRWFQCTQDDHIQRRMAKHTPKRFPFRA